METEPIKPEPITPHKGGRTIMTTVRMTPETAAMLKRLSDDGVTLGDIVDGAVRLNHEMRYGANK